MDPATPVWMRLVIDERSDRVLRERIITKGNLRTSRYFGFGRPIRIEIPDVGRTPQPP